VLRRPFSTLGLPIAFFVGGLGAENRLVPPLLFFSLPNSPPPASTFLFNLQPRNDTFPHKGPALLNRVNYTSRNDEHTEALSGRPASPFLLFFSCPLSSEGGQHSPSIPPNLDFHPSIAIQRPPPFLRPPVLPARSFEDNLSSRPSSGGERSIT